MSTLEILSAGVGVQSITLACLSIDGHLPPLDYAIFADTGWEPPHVYRQLRHMVAALQRVGTQTIVVNNGNIRSDALTDGRFASMPLHLSGPKGNGIARRQCTNEYKLVPIKRKVRQLLGAHPTTTPTGIRTVSRVKKGQHVNMWVGISVDEIERIKPSDVAYIRRRDPLIELGWTRRDCEQYLVDHWPYPVQRSSCIGCPYRTNAEWRQMRDTDPESFADAVDFDHALRRSADGLKQEAFVHPQRVPLDVADLVRATRRENAEKQGVLAFSQSCSPWGCRSE